MNIRDLEYIVALAEEKHFGRAANKCHVSQPALSGQVRKLEDFLGVTLFERTNRKVRLTEIGEQIVAQARGLITLAAEIVNTAEAASDPYSGKFRLGMISTIGPYLSPLILSAIREALPNLSLTLMEGLIPDLEKRLAYGELDGAILATTPADSQLVDVALYDEPFWIALPKQHPLTLRQSIDIEELPTDQLLLLADGHCLRDQMLDVCHTHRAGFNASNDKTLDKSSAGTRETSLETLLALVAAGHGITLVPALAKSEYTRREASLALRAVAYGTAGRVVRLVYRPSFPRLKLLSKLATIIRQNVPEAVVDVRY